MTSGNPEPEGLQFDHAEFVESAAPEVACAACKRPIVDSYHEINGTVVCESCRGAIESQLRGGSGIARFFRAVAFGAVAGVVGTAAYAAFSVATGYDLSLVSIFVGYLIGRAVRAGSRNRGGLAYQLLAVLLTYLAIGATYTIVELWPEGQRAQLNLPDGAIRRAILFAIATVIIPAFRAKQSAITIAIVGFALWQAWKTNVRLRLVVTGPYRVNAPGTEGEAEGAHADA